MNKQQVIVSLTSFPAAIGFAGRAIQSILNGSVLPDKVVLYLTYSQFGDSGIPQEITDLARNNPIFEVRNYDRDIRSYRKLVPALRDFPDAVIVTVDDDVAYDRHLLRDMLRLHKLYPGMVLANRAKRVLPDRPYRKWPKYRWYHFLGRKIGGSFLTLQTGVGGVLYPPHCLKDEMIDEKLFTKIAPTTDDIWFWAAAVANGTPTMPAPFGRHNKPRGLGKPKDMALKNLNFKSGDRNNAAFQAILAEYPIVKQRIEK